MHRALILLFTLGVAACDDWTWSRASSGYSGGGYPSGGGPSLPSERILHGNTNPYHGGYSCTVQSSSGPVRGVRAYDRNRCCADTPAGRSCQ